jgi:hypothetical protein
MPIWTIDPEIRLEKYNGKLVYAIASAASKNAGRNAVKYIRQELERADRVDTGQLAASFKSNLIHTPIGPQFEVYSDLPPLEPSGRTLADIVNDGSGVYGPYGTPIVSPYGNVMRFNPSRRSSSVGRRGVRNSPSTGRFESAYVYSYTVVGQPATKFIDKAMARIKLTDFVS